MAANLQLVRRAALLLALVASGAIWLASGASAGIGTPVVWCGGAEETSTDRPETGVAGLTWHAIYAYASDQPSRFPQLVNGFVTDIHGLVKWWLGQDATRTLRLDLASFPDCDPSPVSKLDISSVQLPMPGAHYQDAATTVDRLRADLGKRGFASPDKKYVVFYDGPYSDAQNCGKGNAGIIDGGAQAYAVMFLAACNAQIGTGTSSLALTVAHEMLHAFNALPSPFPNPGPPNSCHLTGQGDDGHPCDSGTSGADILAPMAAGGDLFANQVLDLNRDDYYGHGQSWFDVRSSLFLSQLDSGDTKAPTAINAKKVKPSSQKKNIIFAFPKAKDGKLLGYRVYVDGELYKTGGQQFTYNGKTIKVKKSKDFATSNPKQRTLLLPGKKKGKVVEVGVRAIDKAGNLGPLTSMFFRMGFGIVKSLKSKKVIRDTQPPNPVKINQRIAGVVGGFTLSWKKTTDTVSKIKSYTVYRNGKKFAKVGADVRSVFVPTAKLRGRWSVRAADANGNQSEPLEIRV